MAGHHQFRSQFGDTTFTKIFVGGLAWETPTEELRGYFEQFGEILEAVIITDKNTGKSKGYGFVTFRDPDSARRACVDPNPIIDGRRANCNIASLGRPRPSPPRGRNQVGNPYHGPLQTPTSYGRVPAPLPPPPPPVVYPSYGYTAYTPDYGYSQTLYNPHLSPQYYHQLYGTSSSTVGSPYPYPHLGYPPPMQASRASFSAPQAHPSQGPPYLHYPAQGEGSMTISSQPYTIQQRTLMRQPVPDSQAPEQPSATRSGGDSESSDP